MSNLRGTIIQTFGKEYAGRIDMCMMPGYKVQHNYAGFNYRFTDVSPFHLPDDFVMLCQNAYCDWLVLDNSSAQFDEGDAVYNNFIEAILMTYTPDRIMLIRSHDPCFIFENGKIIKRDGKNRQLLLNKLDQAFYNKTGCVVLNPSFRVGEHPLFVHRLEWEVHDTINATSKAPYDGFVENSVSTYIYDGGTNISILHNLFVNQPYDYEDLMALHWLNIKMDDILIKAILSNKRAYPLYKTKQLFESNIQCLQENFLCLIPISDIVFEDKIVFQLDMYSFFEISEMGITIFDEKPNEEWNPTWFIENNYTCTIKEIDNALSCFETYFERGRRTCNQSFFIKFNNKEEFVRTLYYIDYTDILSNENYYITTDIPPVIDKYTSKVDLSFLFDKKTRVLCQEGGLAHQMTQYVFNKNLFDMHNLSLYINDLDFDTNNNHNGYQINIMAIENIEKIRFRYLLSKRLRIKYKKLKTVCYPISRNSHWIKIGLKEAFVLGIGPIIYFYRNNEEILQSFPNHWCEDKKEFETVVASGIKEKILFMVGANLFENTSLYRKFMYFPQINEDEARNYQCIKKIQSCDAIAIHLRRGDYKNLTALKKYNELLKKAVKKVFGRKYKKYKNRHLFVFSDDMMWVKENLSVWGGNYANGNITFIDWNHHLLSFRDMQLMSQCKILIYGIGGFSQTAWMMSENIEKFINIENLALISKIFYLCKSVGIKNTIIRIFLYIKKVMHKQLNKA